jgi:CelD/BcsL family acetyltransferase involved in cellulose biosynthesis
MAMQTDLLRSAGARALLSSPSFREDWQQLLDACPWASAYQGPGFATTWYDVYAERFEPVLVTSRDARGGLAGLLALAVSPEGDLAAAGTEHCEYQCWLARPADGDAFIVSALERLGDAFPGGSLKLEYLPQATPLGWVHADKPLARRAIVQRWSRGLLPTEDASVVEASLRKSANRSRLNRLRREGDIAFEHVSGPAEIAALLEEIAPLCDLRHGALYDDPPFQTDPLKAPFHRALASVPGLLHVTALRCGGRIASAHIDIENRGEVVLGLVTHSPWFSQHSPGKLHMLLLARALQSDGYRALDLSPGGGYKERFATRHDDVFSLRVFFGPRQYYACLASMRARQLAKGLLSRLGMRPSELRDRVAKLRPAFGLRGESGSPVRRDGLRLWRNEAVHFYEARAEAIKALPGDARARRNCLAELVTYMPGRVAETPRQEFLRVALERLESGSTVYTRATNGALSGWAWLSDSAQLTGDWIPGAPSLLPPRSAVVHDVALDVPCGAADCGAMLARPLRDALAIPNIDRVFVAVTDALPELRRAIETLGGRYAGSILTRARTGMLGSRSTVSVADQTAADTARAQPMAVH